MSERVCTAWNGETAMLQFLLESKAELDSLTKAMHVSLKAHALFQYGCTALHLAALDNELGAARVWPATVSHLSPLL